jgi:hypothetical protein
VPPPGFEHITPMQYKAMQAAGQVIRGTRKSFKNVVFRHSRISPIAQQPQSKSSLKLILLQW